MTICRVLALVVSLIVALPTAGATFLAMSHEDLLRSSNAVIDGRVLQVDSFWDDDRQIIITEAIIQVWETVAGNAPTLVTVRTFGGEVDGYVIEAHGFPTFAVGERLLLFLGLEKDDVMRVTAYQQGQFRIATDDSGVELAIPATDRHVHLLILKEEAPATLEAEAAPVHKTESLEDLKNAIRADAHLIGLGQQ